MVTSKQIEIAANMTRFFYQEAHRFQAMGHQWEELLKELKAQKIKEEQDVRDIQGMGEEVPGETESDTDS